MKALLLVNPASGREKVNKLVEVAKRKFEEKKYHLDVYFSKCAGDLTEKALKWARDYDTYIVCGGDGTINEVVNGVMQSDVRPNIAVMPVGTVNDISHILGMSRNIGKNLDVIFNNKPIPTDINKINDHYFVYVSGAGYLTEVSYEADRLEKKKYGSLAYLKTAIKGLKKKPFFTAKIECNGEVYIEQVSLLLILSANQFGGMRLPFFAPQGKLNDSLVDIRVFSGRNIWLIFRLVMFILLLGRKQYKQYHVATSKATITPLDTDNVKWNADGELVATGKIKLEVIPSAINFYVNPKRVKKLY